MSVGVLATYGQKDLADVDPSNGSVRFAPSTTHTGLQSDREHQAMTRENVKRDIPISTSTGQHLIDAEDVEGVDTDPQVEGILTGGLGDVLVGTDASSFESLA